MDDLKADCRSAGLVVGGVKYDLVMRLIKHNAAGIEAEPTPAAVKRAVALAKAQDALASPAVGGKRKAACEGKAGGKKRAAAAGADAWCESDGDEEDKDEEDEDDDEEVRAGPVPRPSRRGLAEAAAVAAAKRVVVARSQLGRQRVMECMRDARIMHAPQCMHRVSPQEYEVLNILSSRKAKGGQTEYLVRWCAACCMHACHGVHTLYVHAMHMHGICMAWLAVPA